jgi:hypothetical protein
MMTPALLGALLALGACGTPPPLDQAIRCDEFKHSPDGSWTTTTDVSLDYEANGTHVETNVSKGVTIKAADGRDYADLVAALEKKCNAPNH